jgi:RNA polymerase II subunit A C-terminal domain phosphatase
MQQPDNPNYSAVKDVKAFQLEEGSHMGPCWYFIKVRPGLTEFLEEVSKTYELHVYTMGTRAYANSVAKIVDPQKKYFGDRVLSRDESGSMCPLNGLIRRYG